MGFFYWGEENDPNKPAEPERGFFYWGDDDKPEAPSRHERAHERACRGEGIPYRWVDRSGEQVIEGTLPSSKRGAAMGAVELYAGYLAGGGDAGGDRRAAEGLAREAGISMAEVERRARRYL